MASKSINLILSDYLNTTLPQAAIDATAGAKLPEDGDGYAAALVNFRFMANAVWTTEEVKQALNQLVARK